MAFWGRISDERLTHIFKIANQTLLNRVKIVLGDEYLNAQYRYRTNIDIASLFMAWCLELETSDSIFYLMHNYVKDDWCWSLANLIGMAHQGEGFVCPRGDWLHVGKLIPPLRPFLLWTANGNKEVRRASAQIGLQGIKDFLKSREAHIVRDEVAKWLPRDENQERAKEASPPKRKRGRPVGSYSAR